MNNLQTSPEFSDEETDYPSQGKTTIAPDVLIAITRLTTLGVHGVSQMSPVSGGVNRYFQKGASEGVRLQVKDGIVSADLYIILEKNFIIKDVSLKVQQQVHRAITETVGMPVGMINIHVEDINYSEESEA
jgi:uncharacterized alkaline shock family protein YloU